MVSRRLSAPAVCTAASSPTLWPTTASGYTPHDRHSRVSAICSTTLAGCATSVADIFDTGSSASISASTDQPATSRNSASHSSAASRNTPGPDNSSRPIAHHCGPMPV